MSSKLPKSKTVTLENGRKVVWLRRNLKSYAIGVYLFNKEGRVVSTSRFPLKEAKQSFREMERLIKTGGQAKAVRKPAKRPAKNAKG